MLALEGGPPSFPQDFAGPVVLRYPTTAVVGRRLPDSHRLWWAFPVYPSADTPTWRCIRCCQRIVGPYNPGRRTLLTGPPPVWAVQAVSLATTAALSHLIPLPRGTEMFQFPRCPSRRLCIQRPMRGVAAARVAPFGVAWLIARLQLPRHVSPLSASFLGSWPLRHPPCTPSRLARFPSAASVCCAAILRARFGKIEVIHDM